MFTTSIPDSTDSDVRYVEKSPREQNPPRNNTPDILNSTDLSGAHAREVITISSVASLNQRIVTFESDSNEPTLPYGYGRQQPIIFSSLNVLNLPMSHFNVIIIFSPAPETEAQWYPTQVHNSPISPEVFDISVVSTLTMEMSTVDAWQRAAQLVTIESKGPRRITVASNPSSALTTTRTQKQKLSLRTFFPKKGGSQHTCKDSDQILTAHKTPKAQSELRLSHFRLNIKSKRLHIFINFVPTYWTIFYTEHLIELIQSRADPLRNKRVLIE